MLAVIRNFDGETCRAAAIYLLSRKVLAKSITLDIRQFSYREGAFVTKVIVEEDKVTVIKREGVIKENLEIEDWAAERDMNFPMACAWIVEFVRLCGLGGKFEISLEEVFSNVYDLV